VALALQHLPQERGTYNGVKIMFSPLSFLKPLLYLVIVLVIAGGLYYVTNIKADLAISEANSG
jgi:hypothetical protein